VRCGPGLAQSARDGKSVPEGGGSWARIERRALMWQNLWPIVGDVRRLGAMCALELVRPTSARTPAEAETKGILNFCHTHGVVAISARSFGNVIRLLMPLVIADTQLNEALDVSEEGIGSVTGAEETTAKSRS
jgi:4-aminobutyrate aminotransferase / (S)-3-amino-2-methylpropionate transaminase / 5-aminovalerate transaminase